MFHIVDEIITKLWDTAMRGSLNMRSLPDYKPVSVPLRAAAIHLDRTLLSGSSDLPESS
jgi:hypothetical protein